MIAVSRTNRGLVRHNNEDSVLVREPDLFAIADGMGGADAGEVASYEAVHLLESLDLSQVDRTNILSSLETAIIRINKKIFDLASEKKALSGMGTTLTALYLPNRETAYVAHVGDSRIYLYGEGLLRQVTSDHSYVAELLRHKKITAEEARTSSQKHVITRAVGVEPTVAVDTFEILLGSAQKLLLCSDGLTNMISEAEIERIMGDRNLDRLADGLMNGAMTAGGDDNISFIIIDLEAAEWKKEEPSIIVMKSLIKWAAAVWPKCSMDMIRFFIVTWASRSCGISSFRTRTLSLVSGRKPAMQPVFLTPILSISMILAVNTTSTTSLWNMS